MQQGWAVLSLLLGATIWGRHHGRLRHQPQCRLYPHPLFLEAQPPTPFAGTNKLRGDLCCSGLALVCLVPSDSYGRPGWMVPSTGRPSTGAGQNPGVSRPRAKTHPRVRAAPRRALVALLSLVADGLARQAGGTLISRHMSRALSHRAASWEPQAGQATPPGPWERSLRESAPS